MFLLEMNFFIEPTSSVSPPPDSDQVRIKDTSSKN